MTTISIKQMAYETETSGEKLGIISDLEKVSACEEIFEKTFGQDEEKQFKCLVIKRTEKGVDKYYRVPKTVLSALKIFIMNDDSFDMFKVVKTGSGIEGTKYTVMPVKA